MSVSGPRWALAALTALMAGLLAWAALALPWRFPTLFGAVAGVLAIVHAATAVAAIAGHPIRLRLWRLQSWASLVALALLTAKLAASALYLSDLYGGLGHGVAAALALVWTPFALALLPLSLWGIANTGGWRRRTGAAVLLLVPWVAWDGRVREQSLPRAAVQLRAEPATANRPPWDVRAPVQCRRAPAADHSTVLLTATPESGPARSQCLQGTPAEVAALVARHLARAHGPAVVDEIVAVGPLRAPLPALDGLALRPGQDGVCGGASCFAPWQLVSANAFATHTPISAIPDLHFGVDLGALRGRLGAPLTRISTRTTIIDDSGRAQAVHRLRAERTLAPDEVAASAAAAERFVLGSQQEDGAFAFVTQPFEGSRTMAGYGIPRQAGTTLALCELGSPAASEAARRSIALLRSQLSRQHDWAAAALPPFDAPLRLGPSALTLAAFITCRDRLTSTDLDADIGALGRLVMRFLRPEGGWYSTVDAASAAPRAGPQALYADGQAVLALVLWERLARGAAHPSWPPASEIRDAVERAMAHTAKAHWPSFLRDFFFLEENWHCLAARAALQIHPHAAYERFCLDYVASRERLVLGDEVDRALVGGFGFGNVIPPQNTPTAGYGEALAAAIAIKDARGVDATAERRTLARVMTFLLRHQWRAADCFACPRPHQVIGGWSESLAAPTIRIDYVQHAWAALGHGARALWGPRS